MEIKFEDKQKIALIETEDAAKTKFPISVINSCRKKLNALRAAVDERDIRNWKSFHYEKLKGDKDGMRSIRINDQWRLIFKLNDESSPPSITILEIDDYH
jgi:proteic killer suppression protein